MVYKGSVRVGGDRFDDAIINYIRRNYGMLIGEPTAEAIKKSIGSAFPGSEVKEMEVKGRNLSEGVPRSFTISSNEILEALTDPLNQIVSAVKTALEHTPPELVADFCRSSLAMCSFTRVLTAPLKRVQVMDLLGHGLDVLHLPVHGDGPEYDVGDLGHAEDLLLVDVEEGRFPQPPQPAPQ